MAACAILLLGAPSALTGQSSTAGRVLETTSSPSGGGFVVTETRPSTPGPAVMQNQTPLSTSLAYGLLGGFVGGAVGFYTVPYGVFIGAPVGFLVGIRLSGRGESDQGPPTGNDRGRRNLTWPLLGAGLGGVAAVIQGSNDDDFVCDEKGCRDPRALSDEERAVLYAGTGLVTGLVVNGLRDDAPDSNDLSVSVAPSFPRRARPRRPVDAITRLTAQSSGKWYPGVDSMMATSSGFISAGIDSKSGVDR